MPQMARVHVDVAAQVNHFLGEDIGKSVGAINDWIKSAKVLEITGALLESSIVDGKGAASLSELPTKEQTRAMLLGAISAPARTLVQIINAPGASLARVVNAHADQTAQTAQTAQTDQQEAA